MSRKSNDLDSSVLALPILIYIYMFTYFLTEREIQNPITESL